MASKEKNLKWFHSYLTNRKQFLKCRDQNTDLEVLQCDVPQGSILGPLLFLIFIRNIYIFIFNQIYIYIFIIYMKYEYIFILNQITRYCYV